MKQLKSTKEKIITNKKICWAFLICFLILVSDAFCESGTSTTSSLNDIFYTVYSIFTGWYTKVIALAGVILIGVKMITSKGEERLIKALMPWLIAAILIGGGSTICSLFIKNWDTDMSGISSKGSNLLDKL